MYTFDVGNNLASLGFAFLFLKYVLPIVLVIIVGLVVLYFMKPLIKQVGDGIGKVSKKKGGLALLVVIILIIALVTSV